MLLIVDLPCFGSMEKTGAFENNSRKIFFNLFTSEDNLLIRGLFVVFFPLSRVLSAGSRIRSLDEPDRGIKYHRANLRLIFFLLWGR